MFQSRNRHRLCFGLLSAEVRFYFYFASSEIPHLEPPNLKYHHPGYLIKPPHPKPISGITTILIIFISKPRTSFVTRKKKPLASIQTPILLADTPFPLPRKPRQSYVSRARTSAAQKWWYTCSTSHPHPVSFRVSPALEYMLGRLKSYAISTASAPEDGLSHTKYCMYSQTKRNLLASPAVMV